MKKIAKKNVLGYTAAAAEEIQYQKQLCYMEGKPAQKICSNSSLS